jgi:hypothetical protein
VEHGHLCLLHRIHHQPAARYDLACQGTASLPDPMLCHRVVQRHCMYGGNDIRMGLCPLSFPGRIRRGSILPIVSLMTSSWYTKQEAPLRMAIWHAGNIGSSCVSGLLAAGIQLGMEGTLGVRGWKWFLIIEGKCPSADHSNQYLTFMEQAASVYYLASSPSGEFPTSRTTTAQLISPPRWRRWPNIV